MVSQYPLADSNVPTRRVIVVGKTEKGRLKAKLVQLREIAARKRESFHSDVNGSPRESFNESLMARIRQARNLIDESGEVEAR